MAGHCFSEEFECKVPAKLMWSGLFLDAHSCLPKALPHKIEAVQYPSPTSGCVPGGIRHIKFHTDFAESLQKLRHHIELLLKEGEKEIGTTIHEVGGSTKEALEKVDVAVQKVAGTLKGDVEKIGETFHKLEDCAKKDVEKLECELNKVTKGVATSLKNVGAEAITNTKKVGEGVVVDVKKVEEGVIGEVKKVGESTEKIIAKEELFVKEKIEEVDHEALKIKVCVIGGGLLGEFIKNYKHTFEFKEHFELKDGGCILHWVTEFESLPKNASKVFEELKKDFVETFKGVEKYFLEHVGCAH